MCSRLAGAQATSDDHVGESQGRESSSTLIQ
jgi:hypothetical protein